tara:strand:- start:944 stop:1156 length:213 start_codon:yes stop_codon:yes gene_type:complete
VGDQTPSESANKPLRSPNRLLVLYESSPPGTVTRNTKYPGNIVSSLVFCASPADQSKQAWNQGKAASSTA